MCLEKIKQNSKHKGKTKKKKGKTKKNWFDIECQQIKSEASKTAIRKNKQPWDEKLREKHRKNLKSFRNICKSKKFDFWQKEIKDMDNIGIIDFWKKWKNVGEDLGNKQSTEISNGQPWEDHFKQLFTKEEGDIDVIMKKKRYTDQRNT